MTSQVDQALREETLDTVLIRVNARAWGIATGLIFGLGLFVATIVLVIKGGEDVGSHLGRVAQVLPGYNVSVGGAFIGFVYAFVGGYALGRLLGPRHPVATTDRRVALNEHPPISSGRWGLGIGGLSALALLLVTNALVFKSGTEAGPLLAQLEIYLPGYSVTVGGSIIGSIWLLAIGYGLGRLIGGVYNRLVG